MIHEFKIGDIIIVTEHRMKRYTDKAQVTAIDYTFEWYVEAEHRCPFDVCAYKPSEVRLASDREALQWRLTQ